MSNDWTNKLRDRLTDYQEPVTDDLWAAIQQSLAQQKSNIVSIGKSVDSPDGHSNHQSNAKEVVFRRFSIAAALAALAVGGTYIYLNPTKSNEPIAQATVLQEDSSTSKGALHENQSSEHNQVSQEYSSDNTDTDSPSRLGDDTFTKYSQRVKNNWEYKRVYLMVRVQSWLLRILTMTSRTIIVKIRIATRYSHVLRKVWRAILKCWRWLHPHLLTLFKKVMRDVISLHLGAFNCMEKMEWWEVRIPMDSMQLSFLPITQVDRSIPATLPMPFIA